jgi:hypothetical protein
MISGRRDWAQARPPHPVTPCPSSLAPGRGKRGRGVGVRGFVEGAAEVRTAARPQTPNTASALPVTARSRSGNPRRDDAGFSRALLPGSSELVHNLSFAGAIGGPVHTVIEGG